MVRKILISVNLELLFLIRSRMDLHVITQKLGCETEHAASSFDTTTSSYGGFSGSAAPKVHRWGRLVQFVMLIRNEGNQHMFILS